MIFIIFAALFFQSLVSLLSNNEKFYYDTIMD